MNRVVYANAVDRRVLESINEIAYQLDAYEGNTNNPLELALRLCETPISSGRGNEWLPTFGVS